MNDDLGLLGHVGRGVVNHLVSPLDHIHRVAAGNRQHAGHGPSGRQRRVGGVAGDIDHRQTSGGDIDAGAGADVELVVGGQRHGAVITVADGHRVSGQPRHVADVDRIVGPGRAGIAGDVQRCAVEQANAGASNRHGRLDGLRGNVELRHRCARRRAALDSAIDHISGIAVAAEEGIDRPGETGNLHRRDRSGRQVDQENRVRIVGEHQQILPAGTERDIAG